MCGRYSTVGVDANTLAERFAVHEDGVDVAPSHNVKPTQDAPVVVQHDGKTALRLMRWGLIPPWADDPKIGYKMFNARAETIADKPSFKQSFRKQRCLVPATSFYEWKQEGRGKVPYAFGLENDELFAFAGLYSTWRTPNGEPVATYTIITTEPNELVASVHNRMPVILPQNAERAWLDPAMDDLGYLQSLLVPYDAAHMQMHPVQGAL